jgi:hypothetical protein
MRAHRSLFRCNGTEPEITNLFQQGGVGLVLAESKRMWQRSIRARTMGVGAFSRKQWPHHKSSYGLSTMQNANPRTKNFWSRKNAHDTKEKEKEEQDRDPRQVIYDDLFMEAKKW